MNLLTAELIKDLLPEGVDPSQKKVIGMFGGGFKPPTMGHLEVVKRALQENPEMDALIILVGSGTRNSISQDESLAIWNIYKKYLPNKVRVMASPEGKPPIGAIYSYAKKNPDKEIYWFIGAREGNEEDFQDIAKRTQSLRKGDYSNLKVKEVVTTGAVSGTKARQALLNQDKDTFIQFLPDIPEVDEIWNLLADIVTERINFTPDFITKDDIEAVDDLADEKLSPIEVDLSGNHFFDRLNDPRNFPDISIEELEDFFDKLSDEKEEFIEFLQQYKDVVVKDTETNINIPFMKMANKAIAKTVMRKKNFQTPDKILPLQEIATGSYDGETTIQSRYIINQLKDNLGVYYEEELKRKLRDKKYTLEFKLNPVEPEGLDYAPYLIDAAGGKEGIELIINYEPSSYPQFLNDLIAELKDTLRHELEHVGQENFEKGIRIGNVKNDANLSLPEYLTLDYEIPAFIRGLNKKAKTKNITLGKAIDEFFLERADEISYEEEAYVKRKWAEWIKNNLPKTPLEEAILNEGKYDSLVTKLAGFTLNAWKGDFEDGQSKGYFELEVGPGREFNYPHLFFNYKAKASFVDDFNSTGLARPIKEIPEVELNYRIPLDELPRMWQQISMDMRNTIRHEIEHLMQSGPNVKKGKEMELDRAERDEINKISKKPWWKIWRKTLGTPDYYKLEKEVDANLQGLYLQAKKSRKPLKDIIDIYVKYTLNLPVDEQEEVKRIWAERAPKLNIPLEKDRKTNENTVLNHNQKSAPYGSGYKKLNENFEGRIQSYTDSLSKYMANQDLNIQPLPSLEFIDSDEENAGNIFGKTAYYMPSDKKIVLYTLGRHPKDILRSFAHEMIHHHQNLNGTLENIQTTNTNEDDELDIIEREAYEQGNIMFRNWEDSIKNEN